MLMYGYVAKWKSRFVGWVALLSIVGEFVALSGVVGFRDDKTADDANVE